MIDSTYPVHIPLSDNASFLLHDPIGYGQSYYRGKRASSPQYQQQKGKKQKGARRHAL